MVKAFIMENSGLFCGAASPFGTLGVTAVLEMRLVEAQS